MRKLAILRGAMASGKSTFISEHDLEKFTLSADLIRLMFNSPELTSEYKEAIPQFNNQKVWNLLYFILEERMKKGEFTIIDAVHANKDDFTVYKKLAEKYRYRTFIIDFTDIPKEEVLKRNKNRENYKIVPEYAIERVYKKFKTEKIPSSFQVIKPDEFHLLLTTKPKDFNQYENIHVIGDIHGCFTALKEYFEKNPIYFSDAYIFVGDYFDRGIENTETFQYLSTLMENKNMIFLVGNHEDKLYKYACDDEFKMDYDIKKTIEEFEKNNISKKQLRGFMKKLSQITYLSFRDKTYLISHGGIPYFPNLPIDYYSTNTFIYGSLKYDVDVDKLYHEYMLKNDEKIYQIHGHRNYYRNDIDTYKYSYNLEGNIEKGGYLRILDLNNDGTIHCTKVKNEVFNENLQEETDVYNLIETLRNNKYIYERDLGNTISSFNFTKEAFYNRIWDHITNKARGLFINVGDHKIVARSYDKFFNVNERQETEVDELKKQFVFPVRFYLKYNGFLGILSSYDGELFFASKSTNQGDYVAYFKTIFYKVFNEKQMQAIKNKIVKENVTFVFEVIDPKNDPHIIKYNEERLVLLDMISNQVEFHKLDDEELKKFGLENQIEVKQLIYEAKSIKEFETIYTLINEEEYQSDHNYVEGFVIEDANHFMVKTKTNYYQTWKYLRKKMEDALSKNNFHLKVKNQLEKDFLNFLKNKYENKNVDIKTINIIDERECFLENSEGKVD